MTPLPVPDRIEWTVTASDQAALIRASTWRLWRTFALRLVVLMAAVLGLYFGARWGLFAALLGPAAGAVMAAFLWVSIRRSIRRMFLAAYPVGATVSAEATPDALRLVTAAGATELPWARLTRAQVGEVVVLVRDGVSRQWLTIPRGMFADGWRGLLP